MSWPAANTDYTRLRKNGKEQSCEPCRKSKLRCDHASPYCGRCVRLGRIASCVYDPAPLTKNPAGVRKSTTPVSRSSISSSVNNKIDISSSAIGLGSTVVQAGSNVTSQRPPARAGNAPSKTNPFSLALGGDIGYPRTRQTVFSKLYYGTTSAVFQENKDQLGDSAADDDDYAWNNLSSRPALMKFCVNVLQWLPSREVSAAAIQRYSRISFFITFHLPTLMAFHDRFWAKYGHLLQAPRTTENLEIIVQDFYAGTYRNTVSGLGSNEDFLRRLDNRWEMLGLLFISYGSYNFMTSEDDLARKELAAGATRRDFGLSMLEAADACIMIIEELDSEDNAISLALLQRAVSFQSVCNVYGDTSPCLWKRLGTLVSAVTAQGLHCYEPPYTGNSLFVEHKKRAFATIYGFMTSLAVFLGRPPLISSRYCTTPAVLDVPDEALMEDDLSDLDKRVDEYGWNRQNRVYPATLCRTHYLSSFTYEEILELSLARNDHDTSREALTAKIRGIRDRIETLWRRIPPVLRSEINRETIRGVSQWEACGIICNRLSYLNRLFLLARLDPEDDGTEYLTAANEQLRTVILTAAERDSLSEHHDDVKWFLTWCGIPSASALGIALWKQANSGATLPRAIAANRSEIIQNLVMFMAALDWFSPNDGNYVLSSRARKMVKYLVDGILNPQPTPILNNHQTSQHPSSHHATNHSQGQQPSQLRTPDSTTADEISLSGQMSSNLSSHTNNAGEWTQFDFNNMPDIPVYGVEMEGWFLNGWGEAMTGMN